MGDLSDRDPEQRDIGIPEQVGEAGGAGPVGPDVEVVDSTPHRHVRPSRPVDRRARVVRTTAGGGAGMCEGGGTAGDDGTRQREQWGGTQEAHHSVADHFFFRGQRGATPPGDPVLMTDTESTIVGHDSDRGRSTATAAGAAPPRAVLTYQGTAVYSNI